MHTITIQTLVFYSALTSNRNNQDSCCIKDDTFQVRIKCYSSTSSTIKSTFFRYSAWRQVSILCMPPSCVLCNNIIQCLLIFKVSLNGWECANKFHFFHKYNELMSELRKHILNGCMNRHCGCGSHKHSHVYRFTLVFSNRMPRKIKEKVEMKIHVISLPNFHFFCFQFNPHTWLIWREKKHNINHNLNQ